MYVFVCYHILCTFTCICPIGCGHCKKAKPHFTEAASKFAGDSKVNISFMMLQQVPHEKYNNVLLLIT